jgi:general secretion pathway protein G
MAIFTDPERRWRRQRGITLIEMLVVVTIIAMFGALVAPRLWHKVSGAKRTAAREQINSFITALGMYRLDTGSFPSTDQGLKALRERPPGVERWDGPYLPQEIPNDPWGRPYVYRYPSEHSQEPEIISYGADGQPGGEGENADIVSWRSN